MEQNRVALCTPRKSSLRKKVILRPASTPDKLQKLIGVHLSWKAEMSFTTRVAQIDLIPQVLEAPILELDQPIADK